MKSQSVGAEVASRTVDVLCSLKDSEVFSKAQQGHTVGNRLCWKAEDALL